MPTSQPRFSGLRIVVRKRKLESCIGECVVRLNAKRFISCIVAAVISLLCLLLGLVTAETNVSKRNILRRFTMTLLGSQEGKSPEILEPATQKKHEFSSKVFYLSGINPGKELNYEVRGGLAMLFPTPPPRKEPSLPAEARVSLLTEGVAAPVGDLPCSTRPPYATQMG
eukprot:747193-Hanusia_phi.AAC.2